MYHYATALNQILLINDTIILTLTGAHSLSHLEQLYLCSFSPHSPLSHCLIPESLSPRCHRHLSFLFYSHWTESYFFWNHKKGLLPGLCPPAHRSS